jgi:hypothetical protein
MLVGRTEALVSPECVAVLGVQPIEQGVRGDGRARHCATE